MFMRIYLVLLFRLLSLDIHVLPLCIFYTVSQNILGHCCDAYSFIHETVIYLTMYFVITDSNKRTILFYAHDPADTTPSAGDTLIFRKVLTNAGNGYHKSTGVFTAPESGAYVFSLQLCVDQGNSIYYEIRKEEEIISKGRAYNSTSSVCIVSVAFADLYAGDNVRAVCPYVHGDTKNVITELPVHHHSSFSAVLVN